jgi:hypothetical protein
MGFGGLQTERIGRKLQEVQQATDLTQFVTQMVLGLQEAILMGFGGLLTERLGLKEQQQVM